MDKKDIYEHLANIYLDASSSKKRKSRNFAKLRKFYLLGATLFGVVLVFSLLFVNREKNPNTETALFLTSDPAKINFHFNPAKKEVYSITLNNLNLNSYRALGFSLKKFPYNGRVAVRIELTNAFKEKSEVYLTEIPHRWQSYKINFSQFKKISDFSQMDNLSFIVEVWNTAQDKGIVYLDNIRFLR